MNALSNALPILPILIPMLGAAASLLVEHRRYGPRVQRSLAWSAMLALLAAVLALFVVSQDGQVRVHLLGDWPSHLGIVLVADRLSAWMLLTSNLLAAACLLHACASWDRRAPHFHALFQFQLMGLNGAFLTGDIFNLFVFFEVMLIASYGLLLSGGRQLRLRIGLHYVVFNIVASTLFLLALGLLYAQLGTLNMAALAERIAAVAAPQAALLKATLGLLLLVFCSKAALLPLYLWLPETYSRAPASIAAMFTVMTKVGLYALLRISSLWLGAGAGLLAGYGQTTLAWAGIATLLLAALGVVSASRLRMQVSWLVVFSAATLALAFALGSAGSIGAGLYYLPHSCFSAAALFMIADLIRRRRGNASDRKEIVAALPGRAIPGSLFLIAALAIAGLPPLSGFLAKAALLQQIPDDWRGPAWAALLGGGLLVLIGLSRAGVRLFWRVPASAEHEPARVPPRRARMRPVETVATLLLLLLVLAMSLFAEPLLSQADAAAQQLQDAAGMIQQVQTTLPLERKP